MRTVKNLIEELHKFPSDALCYVYEGELCGIVIARKGASWRQGVIYCSEGDHVEPESDLLPNDLDKS